MASISAQVETALHQSLPQAWQSELQGAGTYAFKACPSVTNTDSAILAMGILSENLNGVLANLFGKTSVIELMLYAASGNPSLKGILFSGLQINTALCSVSVSPSTFEWTRDANPDMHYQCAFAFTGFALAGVRYECEGETGYAPPEMMVNLGLTFGAHTLTYTATFFDGSTQESSATLEVIEPEATP